MPAPHDATRPVKNKVAILHAYALTARTSSVPARIPRGSHVGARATVVTTRSINSWNSLSLS